MRRVFLIFGVLLLLTSCTSLHMTQELVLVDQVTSNSAVRVSVASNGIVDSHAGFLVVIENKTDAAINFFENQITFYSGSDMSGYHYLSSWNSNAYLRDLENEYSGKLTWAAFLCDLLEGDHHHDEHEDDEVSTFFKVASFVNFAATGIDAVSTLGSSDASVLRSGYIPAGGTMYGLVFCEVPWRDDFIKVNVATGGNDTNSFTFMY